MYMYIKGGWIIVSKLAYFIDNKYENRDSNIELLRIVSMTGIVIIHYLNKEYGGMILNDIFPSFSWLFTHFILSICIPLVNCFVLITGYFYDRISTFSLKKPVILFFTTIFYSTIALFIWIALGNSILSFSEIIYMIIPFFDSKRWFVETYIILILFAPFLNIIIRSLDEKKFKILLIIQIAIFSIWYSFGLSAPLLDDGYGIINFITLYFLGAYLKKNNSYFFYKRKFYFFRKFIVFTILTFMLSYFINPFGYAFITNIIGAVSIFIFFIKINIGNKKVINYLASVSFDVYFIHSDKNLGKILIYNILCGYLFVDSPTMIIHLIFIIPIIWGLGIIFSIIRKNIVNFIFYKFVNRFNLLKYEIKI